MRTRLTRIRMRDAALFVAIAALVALVVVFAGGEAGLGGRAGADVEPAAAEPRLPTPEQESDGEEPAEPLTLTLELPESDICEVNRPRLLVSWGVGEDAEHGWRVFEETAVRWRADGGTPPYTLVIDGEPRDANGAYVGQVGQASVSCADPVVGSFFEVVSRRAGVIRLYRDKPNVDSGWKTIRGVVTDGAGGTAEATVRVYLLRGGVEHTDILRRGQTYRVFGQLFTAPADFDMAMAGGADYDNCPVTERCESTFSLVLIGVDAGIEVFESDGVERSRWNVTSGAAGASDAISKALDSLAGSLGDLPQGVGDGE